MADPDLQTDNSFWNFSLTVYAAPGVPDECLAVQERYGVDVNVLLFCAWLARAQHVALTADDLSAIEGAVGPWHEAAVKPLRAVRRALKGRPEGSILALRTRVKGDELEAERLEQAMLFRLAAARWPALGDAGAEAILLNPELYLRRCGYGGPGGEGLPLRHFVAAVRGLPPG